MKKFFQKNGFYVILLLCVAVVAIAAVLATNGNFDKIAKKNIDNNVQMPKVSENNNDILGNIDKEMGQGTTSKNNNTDNANNNNQNIPQSNSSTASTTKTETKANVPVANATPVTANQNFSLIMPVNGTITEDYAMSNLAYSKTLDEWRVHDGIDIGAQADTPVKAAAAGVVEKVYKDDKMGNTVMIKHSGDYETVYESLGENVKVKQGQVVKQGDVIGTVGQSASFEILDGNHVHFGVLKNGKITDPHQFIK